MLEFKDFFHLAELDPLIKELAADGPGLTLVAGFDQRPASPPKGATHLLPSGRSAVFRILMRQILAATQTGRTVVVAEDREAIRVPRQLRRQIHLVHVVPPLTYSAGVAEALRQRPGLLVIDRLCPENISAVLEAARGGLRVLAQLDTIFCGSDVAQSLLDLGAAQQQLVGLRWIITIYRLAALCPLCRRTAPATPDQLALLSRWQPTLAAAATDSIAGPSGTFWQAVGCAECHGTGRYGDVAAFDVWRATSAAPAGLSGESLLSLPAYLLRLATVGYLELDDLLQLSSAQLHRTYSLLVASERALVEKSAAFERKMAEIEAANQVLTQRTEAIITLQQINQALTTSTDLRSLAVRICRSAGDLCGVDRAILYLLQPGDVARVLATSGWDPTQISPTVPLGLVSDQGREPVSFPFYPPGIPPRLPDVEGAVLRAGLRMPLVTPDRQVGLMIVHATRKASFTPGEVALLQAFTNQAALAIQRTELIEQLRDKIAQLEAAQAELVEKERMERELELARQVQQSVLPRTFPRVPNTVFAARNQPARQVGGDFYDVFALDDGRFGLVIGDVTDKGMPAALFMALTRSLLLAEARRESSPRAVLMNVHRLLLELGQPGMFVTVFYGVLDPSLLQLVYARAGHDRPLLLRNGTAQPLGGSGSFIGFADLPDVDLSEASLTLAPGDRLVLYTDGLTDALSPTNEPFNADRLTALVQDHADLRPDELASAVFAGLAAYQDTADQYDDMTLLIMAVN